jgi:hypothetical protein
MSPRVGGALLWVAAVILMLSAAVYQRLTGPTNPVRGELVIDGLPQKYRLLRSEESVRDARIAVPSPMAGATGRVLYRRYPTDEGFRVVPMVTEATEDGREELAGYLPAQPASGKLEYRIEVGSPAGIMRIPSSGSAADGETIVMRFKDPVPLPILLSHVGFMFFAVLVGMRAGLGSLVSPGKVRRDSWVALGLMTVGGMILGPIVQKYAFGAYWTGFPWGYDLTDNKTLVMWVVWIVACGVLGRKDSEPPRWPARLTVLAAAIVMTAVYLIPHSLRGSQLDYGAVDSGTSAEDAVRTGR